MARRAAHLEESGQVPSLGPAKSFVAVQNEDVPAKISHLSTAVPAHHIGMPGLPASTMALAEVTPAIPAPMTTQSVWHGPSLEVEVVYMFEQHPESHSGMAWS
jgi:hypothetical protein